MKMGQLLEEIKLDTQQYLEEDIVKKRGKYFVVKSFDGTPLLGAREEGYASIENAVKEMLALTKKGFRMLPFTKKHELALKYVEKWKKDNSFKEKRKKKKYGFEVRD